MTEKEFVIAIIKYQGNCSSIPERRGCCLGCVWHPSKFVCTTEKGNKVDLPMRNRRALRYALKTYGKVELFKRLV